MAIPDGLSFDELNKLYDTVMKIQNRFAKLYRKNADALVLDIEFKVMGSERKLVFKQVRPYIL